MRHHLSRLAAVATVVALLVGACSVSTNDEPVALGSELFEPLLTTTSTTTSTSIPSSVTKTEEVYLLRVRDGSTALIAVPREVDVDAGVQEVLGNLFTVRPDGEERPDEDGLETKIPETAELVGAALSPGTTTVVVDVRRLFGEGGIQGNDLRDALAQIVWTATEDEAVRSVVFRNDGEPVPAAIDNGETTDEPVTRTDYSSQR